MSVKLLFRYLKIVLLTAVLFLAGFYLVDRIVTPEGRAEEFYDEPRNSIDVLIVGGSQVMGGLSTNEIYEQTGLTAYNFSTWSQPIWVSYYYVKEALKYQQPKVVVIDVFGACYDRSYLTGVDVDLVSDDHAQLLKPSLNLLQLNLTRRRVQVTPKRWYEYFNIAKYHSRITELTAASVNKMFTDYSTTSKGYGPFYSTENFSGYTYPVTDERVELYPYAREYLEQIVILCRKNNIIPVFVKMPQIATQQDVALMNTVQDLANEWSVPFLDFCSTNVLELDFATDFSDHGHLNVFGAKKATAALVAFLNTLQLQVTHSPEVEQRWQEACAIERNAGQKMEIRLADSFALLLARVQNHPATAVIVVKQDGGSLHEADYTAIDDLLQGTLFAAHAAELRTQSVFVYVGGQVLAGDEAMAWCAEHGVTVTVQGAAEVQYNGTNYSYGRNGLNIALLDTEAGEMYHYLTFAQEHEYQPYTR